MLLSKALENGLGRGLPVSSLSIINSSSSSPLLTFRRTYIGPHWIFRQKRKSLHKKLHHQQILTKKREKRKKEGLTLPTLNRIQWQAALGLRPYKIDENGTEYHLRIPKPPVLEREPSPRYLMKQLRIEERDNITTKFPRNFPEFRSGDKLSVTQLQSLHGQPKLEVHKGVVIARTGKFTNYNASFTLMVHKLGETFEITWPIYCPFIKKIELLEKGYKRRKKLSYLRETDPETFEIK